jgi:hypothetical protein
MRKDTIDRIRKFSEDRDWDQFHSPDLFSNIYIHNGGAEEELIT